MRRRHGDHRNVESLAPDDALEVLDVEDRDAAPRFVADLFIGRIEERRDLKPFLTESRIVRKGKPEVARPHDRHTQAPIESENLAEVTTQFLDVVADTSHTELTKVREVLANLRRVEMKLLGQRLRRDCL